MIIHGRVRDECRTRRSIAGWKRAKIAVISDRYCVTVATANAETLTEEATSAIT